MELANQLKTSAERQRLNDRQALLSAYVRDQTKATELAARYPDYLITVNGIPGTPPPKRPFLFGLFGNLFES